MKNILSLISSILMISFVFVYSTEIKSQCTITATANPNNVCAGSPVTLSSIGECGILMNNNFNNGTLGSGFSSAVGASFDNPCGNSPNGIYLWMGNNVPIPRTLTTIPFNVLGVCQITFWMRFSIQGQTSPCEGPDLVDEGVSLQYTTNGGVTYTDIVYFRPDGVLCPGYPWTAGWTSVGSGLQTPFTTWQQYTFTIPAAAQSPNTQFRWRQHTYSGQGFDHWGVDEIMIQCPSDEIVTWSHGATGFNPPAVFPTSDSCFIVAIYDAFNPSPIVSDTVCVIVNPMPPTPTISLNGNILTSDAPVGNQWYDQNGLINGATNQNYTVTANGDYYVVVELLGCSSGASNIVNVTNTNVELVDSDRNIKIYPNPVSNELIIEIEGNNEKVNFEILNTVGQIVFNGSLVEKTIVQTSDFATGLYLIKLDNGKTFEFKKIIKH